MKVHIYCDERYPDYGIDREPHAGYRTVEVSDEVLAEVEAAETAYRTAQGKLRELLKQQKQPA